MKKIVFYGTNVRTLSMAEDLQVAYPQCKMFFLSESTPLTLKIPAHFGKSIEGMANLFFEDVDFVIIDQSFKQAQETLDFIRKYLPETAFVIDLQSVKSDFYQMMSSTLDGICQCCAAYIFADLSEELIQGGAFRDKITALICDNEPQTLGYLKEFWSAFGAKVIPTSSDFFDEITASTVSGGLLLSSMYLHILQSDSWADTLFFGFYNRGLRQSTATVSSNPTMDAEALIRNKEHINHMLLFFKREIDSLEHLLEEENKEKLSQYLEQAKKFQDRI
ncbi:MAG: prephenate dehydrogenase dimerization domain-containing protein [Brevinema sp.]